MIALWQFITKRGSTYVGEILLLGGDFVVLELWSFRLYLGASFLAHDVFFVFVWVVHDKGRYIDDISFLFHIIY